MGNSKKQIEQKAIRAELIEELLELSRFGKCTLQEVSRWKATMRADQLQAKVKELTDAPGR